MRRKINQDDLEKFYKLIGRAVWHIQYFEDVLVHYITMKLRIEKPISIQDAYALLEKEQKNTMGKLLNSAKKGGLIPGEHKERFFNLLKERNWLIHNCRKLNNTDLYHNLKREQLFQRIDRIYEESEDLKKVLFQALKDWLVSQGIDMNKVNEMAIENIRQLSGR